MNKSLLVLLGNTNDQQGTLSESAILRAQEAIRYLQDNPNCIVLPTGSFGVHFNESSTPHGELLASYLREQGVDSNAILSHTRSGNTFEDAICVLRLLSSNSFTGSIHIVTSQFHMARVKYIFGRVLEGYTVDFIAAPDPTDQQKLKSLYSHERRALCKARKEWVDLAKFDITKFPEASYASLGNELRHYDNLSYFPIVGAVVFAGYFSSHESLPTSTPISELLHTGATMTILAFWYLYLRLADTAASARRVISAIERIYRVPGLSATQTKTGIWGASPPIKHVVDFLFAAILLFVLV